MWVYAGACTVEKGSGIAKGLGDDATSEGLRRSITVDTP